MDFKYINHAYDICFRLFYLHDTRIHLRLIQLLKDGKGSLF